MKRAQKKPIEHSKSLRPEFKTLDQLRRLGANLRKNLRYLQCSDGATHEILEAPLSFYYKNGEQV
jgi:hypothetical protein